MEVLKMILAAMGCLGLMIVGSCTMLGMAGAQMVNKAVELEEKKQAERASNASADSSRFGGTSRYEYQSSTSYREPTEMDDPDWKFGDPTTEVK
jgi:hypothetical protein